MLQLDHRIMVENIFLRECYNNEEHSSKTRNILKYGDKSGNTKNILFAYLSIKNFPKNTALHFGVLLKGQTHEHWKI